MSQAPCKASSKQLSMAITCSGEKHLPMGWMDHQEIKLEAEQGEQLRIQTLGYFGIEVPSRLGGSQGRHPLTASSIF